MDAEGCMVVGGEVPEAVVEAGYAQPVVQQDPAAAQPQPTMQQAAPVTQQAPQPSAGDASPPPAILAAPSFNAAQKTADLAGKVAMVTGASTGVGLAVVNQFVHSGASVIMVDNNEEALQAAVHSLGGNANMVLPITGDTAHKAAVDFMIQQGVQTFGRLDILVCCAAGIATTPMEQISEQEWGAVLGANLTGPFLCVQAASALMKQSGAGGRIITVASQAAKTLNVFGGVHYHASKAGLLGLTRQSAKELGQFGITVNTVCPGAIDTDDFHQACMGQHLRLNTPLKRLGLADEVANVVSFLASDLAAYVTGASYDVNGGDVMV